MSQARDSFRFRSSHHGFGGKKTPKPAPPCSGWKQRERDEKARLRLREQEDQKMFSVRQALLARFTENSHDSESDDMDTRGYFMARIMMRLDRAADQAVQSYRSISGRFNEFPRVFNAFCRHALALKSDAASLYVRIELQHALDKQLMHFAQVLRTIDRQVVKRQIDAKTFELLLSREVHSILAIDVDALAKKIISEVEHRLIELADTGRQVPNRSRRDYRAVMCQIGVLKRSRCFLILTDDDPSVLVTLQSPKKFARFQKRANQPKGDITKRGQRYSNRPEHLRHHLAPRPRLLSWTRGLFRLKMALT